MNASMNSVESAHVTHPFIRAWTALIETHYNKRKELLSLNYPFHERFSVRISRLLNWIQFIAATSAKSVLVHSLTRVMQMFNPSHYVILKFQNSFSFLTY